MAPHFVDHSAHRVAQALDDPRGKANVEKFGRDLIPNLDVFLASMPVIRQRLFHLFVQAANLCEPDEGVDFELQQACGKRCAAIVLFLLEFLVDFLFLDGLLDRVFLGIGIDQAVDQFVDAHLFALDLGCQGKNFVDCGGTG